MHIHLQKIFLASQLDTACSFLRGTSTETPCSVAYHSVGNTHQTQGKGESENAATLKHQVRSR